MDADNQNTICASSPDRSVPKEAFTSITSGSGEHSQAIETGQLQLPTPIEAPKDKSGKPIVNDPPKLPGSNQRPKIRLHTGLAIRPSLKSQRSQTLVESQSLEHVPELSQAPKKRKLAKSSGTKAHITMAHAHDKYSGLSFQHAQEKIIEDTIKYQENPNDEIPAFGDFIDLPPRSLKDYYEATPHPMSLRLLQKIVKGTSSTRGKSSSLGTPPFKTWAAFEEEFSYIWKNTFEYNIEDSEIYARGKQLETFVKKALKEAKQVVPDQSGQVATPSTGPKIKLKVTRKGSPQASPAPQSSIAVSNGATVSGSSRSSKRLRSSTPTSADKLERPKSAVDSVASPAPPTTAPAKSEEEVGETALGRNGSQAASTPGLNGNSMPPPSTPGLASPHTQVGQAQSSYLASQTAVPTPDMDFSHRLRAPGQTIADALITTVVVTTHPGLHITEHASFDLKPSATLKEVSHAFHMTSEQCYIQIKPALAGNLIDRQHKMFVLVNSQILPAMPMIPGHPVDLLHPLFETRLDPGINRIEIQIRAALPAASRRAGELDYEEEFWTMFPNVFRK